MLAVNLVFYLKADSGINTMVGGRVYPNYVPQGSAFPSISYSQTSGVRLRNIDNGPTGRAMPRITINSWAAKYFDVRTLANMVRLRLDGFQGIMGTDRIDRVTLDNEFDAFEEEAGTSGIHRVMQDYIISFVEGA